jgi:putative tryptophan/tyrosine transport system substrate-binding protein
MRRREVVTLLGGAAAWPLAASAQEQGRIYRLGVLSQGGRQQPQYLAFFDELRLFDFIEGRNLTLVPGSFDAPADQLAARAAMLVKAVPDVLLGIGDLATRALQAATQSIPIVGGAEDMVAAGLVASLSRPGANITGVSMLSPELDGKRQDILIEAVPGARRLAALVDATQTPQSHISALQDAARARGVELLAIEVHRREQIGPAIDAAKTSGAQAVNVLASAPFSGSRRIIFERMAALRLPAIYQWAEMADEGGFAAYGPRLSPAYRQRARMVAKILRGAKPADIPVEQPTHFELVINLKTAQAIGHEVPAGLVLRADKVIE